MIPGNPFRRLSGLLAALLLVAAPGLGRGDVLDMPQAPAVEAERPLLNVEVPVRGMSMQQVEKRFGAPLERRPPVGDPPITRWVYDGYTVYFEHQHVIHSVLNRP